MAKASKQQKNNHGENQPGQKAVEVTFALDCPSAREVYVCGDFNEWSPNAFRMVRSMERGRWEKRLVLPPGRYEYRFVVDGDWTSDPASREDVINGFGSINSVVEVR